MESNIGLLLSYTFTILLMIGLPLLLVYFLTRRFKVSWWVILAGVVAYIVSQAIQYPVLKLVSDLFNKGSLPVPSAQYLPLFYAVILGFFAALFEESARYFAFLVVRKKAKDTPSAVGMGLAHGGFESIALALWPFWPIFGGLAFQFFKIIFFNPASLQTQGYTAAQISSATSQIAQFWTIPWHTGLLPAADRIVGISLQMILAVLVWKSIKKHNFGWFALAFFYHLLVVGISSYLQYSGWSYWAIDGIMLIFVLVNLYLIYAFWKQDSEKDEDDEDEDEDDDDEEDDDEDVEDEDEDIEVDEDIDDDEDDEDEDEDK